MALDADDARNAFKPVADRLGYSLEKAAHGVISIVVSNMVRSIRSVSVERGHDPREFTLFAFGGAGPLHATEVARSLGIREILVPPEPGILCAQGLVVSDLTEDFVRTDRLPLEEESRSRIERHLAALTEHADKWFLQEAIEPGNRILEVSLDLRYVGQNFEIAVRLHSAALPPFDELRDRFFKLHEQSYGYFNPDDPVEMVNLRLAARGRLKFDEPHSGEESAREFAAPPGERVVWFDPDWPAAAKVYQRAGLKPGQEIEGPAVIEQLDTTTMVFPGDRARVDPAYNLLIKVRS
jgi:N-methylhydantoinase A